MTRVESFAFDPNLLVPKGDVNWLKDFFFPAKDVDEKKRKNLRNIANQFLVLIKS